jgi:hypothetical protein
LSPRCGVADYSSELYTEHGDVYYLTEDYDNAVSDFEDQEEEGA